MSTDQKFSAVIPSVSTGVAGLNDILPGGWPAHHLYLVEGSPGSGKTTLALQFLLAGAERGEKVLYVTLAESKPELEAVAASHGIPLAGIQIYEYAPTEESLRQEHEYSALYRAEVELQDVMQAILDKVDEIQPSRLVLDSLSEIRTLARDDLRYRRQVLALKHFFLNRSTTVLMLDELRRDQQDSQLQSIAHGALSLERLERDYGVDRRRLRVAKLRGSSFREGFHDYTIKRGGLEVYPRLVASEHRKGAVGGAIESGIPTLDELVGGGIPLGTSTVVKGPSGSGKSAIVTRYAYHSASLGRRAAIFQFDETAGTTLKRSKALGMDLQPLIDENKLVLRQIDPAEVQPGEFVSYVRNAVENLGIEVVAIDTINGFLNGMAGEERLLLQMHELCAYLNQRGVATFLVLSQSGVVGAESPVGADLSYLADNVMLLNHFEAFGEVRKAISMLKMRTAWHEPTIRELRFTAGHFLLGEPLKDFRGVLSGIPEYTGSPASLNGALSAGSQS